MEWKHICWVLRLYNYPYNENLYENSKNYENNSILYEIQQIKILILHVPKNEKIKQ